MFNFVEQRPTKQGTKYGISLGQNNGPYLIKDMMVSNPKSIQFLTGNQIANSTNKSISASMHHLSSPGKTIQLHPPPVVYDKKNRNLH